MKHGNKRRKFGREKNQRKALLKSLSSSLFLKEKIKTGEAKAKELSKYAEKMITKAKTGSIASKRHLSKQLSDPIVKKLMDEIAPRYKDRNGGYTRVIKLGQRESDGSKMAIIELVK